MRHPATLARTRPGPAPLPVTGSGTRCSPGKSFPPNEAGACPGSLSLRQVAARRPSASIRQSPSRPG
jgi:hypothetical protein